MVVALASTAKGEERRVRAHHANLVRRALLVAVVSSLAVARSQCTGPAAQAASVCPSSVAPSTTFGTFAAACRGPYGSCPLPSTASRRTVSAHAPSVGVGGDGRRLPRGSSASHGRWVGARARRRLSPAPWCSVASVGVPSSPSTASLASKATLGLRGQRARMPGWRPLTPGLTHASATLVLGVFALVHLVGRRVAPAHPTSTLVRTLIDFIYRSINQMTYIFISISIK